jgi:hypothetical protein
MGIIGDDDWTDDVPWSHHSGVSMLARPRQEAETMTRKMILLAALLGAGATPALAQQHRPPPHPPSEGLCTGRVLLETVRPKTTIPGGFTYELLLQNQTASPRVGYRVTVVLEGFDTLAQQTGSTIHIPNRTLTITVPAGHGSRSAETQFGTVSRNVQQIYYQAGVGARYDSGPLTNGGPAAVRLANCVPIG